MKAKGWKACKELDEQGLSFIVRNTRSRSRNIVVEVFIELAD